MSIEGKIKNVELLTSAFGRFPSFHDAEVMQITLRRGDKQNPCAPELFAVIHCFNMVRQPDANGSYLRNHHLVSIRFSGITDASLTGFNGQNVLWDLLVEDIVEPQEDETKYKVIFESTYGVGAEFKCAAITIEAVEPYDPGPPPVVDEKTKQERLEFLKTIMRKKDA